MAAIAKFVSFDGGVAFSEKVMKVQKCDQDAVMIPLGDVITVGVRRPQEDSDGSIRIETATGQRYRIFFEDDQVQEAIQFKRRFDVAVADDEDDEALVPAVTTRPIQRRSGDHKTGPEAYPEYGRYEKAKKPLLKRWWLWAIMAVLVIAVAAPLGGGNDAPAKEAVTTESPASDVIEANNAPVSNVVEANDTPSPDVVETSVPTEEPVAAANDGGGPVAVNESDSGVPTEYRSALASAETYVEIMHMSKAGLYDQLTSEYGDKFSPEAAQYAVDNISADWKEVALRAAESYSETMHMSKNGIYDQLTSEYGEKFTAEEAQYAVDNIIADWNENALASARNYQESMNMSLSAIHDQLTSEYGEQFTQEEADYAIEHLG